MAYRIVVQPQAEADVAEAFTYLSERAPEAAARWYRRVRDEIASLDEMPLRCPLAPEGAKLGYELRHLLYGRRPGIYRIVFRVVEERWEVHVLAVRHGARKPLTDEDVQPFLEMS
jgi:toxin ParE1/3/4